MGEGYSMITMTKRWPTIIGDFLKMKSEWTDVKFIREELKVTNVEANVLKTKNELFKEWKKLFFPDVRERYGRIKNLLESRRRSVEEYREWLKPYLNRLKMIREKAEITDTADDLTEITKFTFTPQGIVEAKIWIWKPIRPEEMGKGIVISGWGEIPIFDDWVKEHLIALEAKYDVTMDEEQIRKFIENQERGGKLYGKRSELMMMYPNPQIDKRFLYYFFVDLDYICQYKKGSTGPMVVEDQYWHFHPNLVSKNFLLLMQLELKYKALKFAQDIEKLIGVSSEEKKWMDDVKKEYALKGEKTSKKEKFSKRWNESWKERKITWVARRRKLKKMFKPILR
jgi:hypothetical protein